MASSSLVKNSGVNIETPSLNIPQVTIKMNDHLSAMRVSSVFAYAFIVLAAMLCPAKEAAAFTPKR